MRPKINHKLKTFATGLLLALGFCLLVTTRALAVSYSEGTYGADVYQAVDPAASSTGILANTGINVWMVVSIAAVAIGVGGLLILLRRRARKQSN